eukprot:1607115-Prymnesium_polylepis.1
MSVSLGPPAVGGLVVDFAHFGGPKVGGWGGVFCAQCELGWPCGKSPESWLVRRTTREVEVCRYTVPWGG